MDRMRSPELSPARIYFIAFVFILVAAVWIRLPYLGIHRMWPDEALYAWCAQRIFHAPPVLFSKEIIAFHPPLFPLLLSLGHFFFPPELACRIIVMLINVLGIAGTYLLGVRLRSHFLGCLAALITAFNFLYLNQSLFILADGCLAVALIFVLTVLQRVTPTPPCRKDLFVGLAACAVILIKWPGVLVIPFLTAYYLLALDGLAVRERVKKLTIPLVLTVGITVLLLINNKIQLGHWLPDTSAVSGLYLVKPFWYYAKGLSNILIVPFLIPFFVFGLWLAFQKDHRPFLGPVLWLVIYFVAISFAKEKDLRYSLPAFPVIVLLSALGVEEAIRRLVKDEGLRFKLQAVFLALVAGFFVLNFAKTERILHMVSTDFTGFREAGQAVREERAFSSDLLVVASSPRTVRYYTGINFLEFNGRLLPAPKTVAELSGLVRRSEVPVVLIVDAWEKTNSAWVLPLPEETAQALDELHFKLLRSIDKNHRVSKTETVNGPVVQVFRYDP
jgi:hypothetical protein